MQIIIDTSTELSDLDFRVLAVLCSKPGTVDISVTEPAPQPKRRPRKVAEPEPTPEPEPEPTPEPEPEEDLLGTEGPTREDAVALVTRLLAEDKTKEVRAALAKFHAKRVTNVADDDLAAFVAELS